MQKTFLQFLQEAGIKKIDGKNEHFMAGYRWQRKQAKTKNFINAAIGADAHLKSLGMEGTRHMSATQNPSVKARINTAKGIYDDFIDGASQAHSDALKDKE